MADTVIPQMTVDQMAVLSMSFLSKDICVFFKFDLGSPRTFARSLRSIWLTELSRRTDGSALTEFRGRVSLLYDYFNDGSMVTATPRGTPPGTENIKIMKRGKKL